MMHILVINPEYETLRPIHRWFNAEGYKVKLWSDDPKKIDLTELDAPTLIIGDWQHKGLSKCLPVWNSLKANPKVPPVFCLMLISQAGLEARSDAVTQGVDDWLLYPVDPVELKARVLASKHILKLKLELQMQTQLLETELSEAEAYVRSLLPTNLTEKVPINARFIPSRMLGGDCYDFYWLDPDYLVMYVLDVSGHGLGSALLSTSVLNMLRSQSLPDVNFYRPEKVLRALNDTFQMNDQNEKYFTIWYGVYNRANRQLMYASAGHPPAVLLSKQGEKRSLQCLKTAGLPIGMLPDIQYRWKRFHIPPDSRLYLFSDGVYEIKQKDNTMMSLDDFLKILSVHAPERTIDDILSKVEARTQSQTFSDDLSLLEVCLD
ncbi:SpoIIE family protein phosphatase [Oscillatoria sp. CS-180]|uniref:SpoIIE family protein phosphatase n=1 Tax=Oscillatoria sp. CS-180 TaxID=3021720 RepID=UPI002330EFE5|nr:SpoIIE family protein phosphatase [Oscillatoria sp. CS-180]MDB9525275.1 SpoIIE family protein phosphatase [Oscillatoria sp. CS-180]